MLSTTHQAARRNPVSSEPLDHILHEAEVYLSRGAGLSSKFHSEEISRQKEKDLLEKESHRLVQWDCFGGCRVTMTRVDMPITLPSSAALEQQHCAGSAPSAREASEQREDLRRWPHVTALGLFPNWSCRNL